MLAFKIQTEALPKTAVAGNYEGMFSLVTIQHWL